jgi:hypothetical protein
MAGGFILITGIDGSRYAVRQHAVAVINDADECHDSSLSPVSLRYANQANTSSSGLGTRTTCPPYSWTT